MEGGGSQHGCVLLLHQQLLLCYRCELLLLQESLEELGESAVSRLKRRSLISLYDAPSDRECSPSPSHASPRPVRTPQLLASLGLDLDNVSLGNRYRCLEVAVLAQSEIVTVLWAG